MVTLVSNLDETPLGKGRIHGPAMESERLVSRGFTNTEKALAATYGVGEVVTFYRPYKRIDVKKGDERAVIGVDHRRREVLLDDGKGGQTLPGTVR